MINEPSGVKVFSVKHNICQMFYAIFLHYQTISFIKWLLSFNHHCKGWYTYLVEVSVAFSSSHHENFSSFLVVTIVIVI